ncbi:MAG: nucleotidyl transferase AbiEii/AbiGii toxin family protein [Planctomycetes bacterium]|nr:nucleotidyl transferase AbiEii/AbiGii toxin family protein [Planctomycetota bacterium]
MSGLTPAQTRMLTLLAPLRPRWTLTGGAALVGFHQHQRTTRDLDLFVHGASTLGRLPDEALAAIRHSGLPVETMQRSDTFARLRVQCDAETVLVDLVAEPVPHAEPPHETALGEHRILVDTRHEILVNKLGTLLHRREPRDLEDLRLLLATGGDLRRALVDAAQKDGGFSPLTVGWALAGFDVRPRALAIGMPEARVQALEAFRSALAAEIAALARP